jgi:ComF family protein
MLLFPENMVRWRHRITATTQGIRAMINLDALLSTAKSFLVNNSSQLYSLIRQELRARPCLLCDATTADPAMLCADCIADLPWNRDRCKCCALPLPHRSDLALLCGECLKTPAPFERVLAPFRYEFPLDRALHQFKYQGKRYWQRSFATLMEAFVQFHYADTTHVMPQVLIPVPMHTDKQKTRGFNQSELLAKGLSRNLNIPTDNNWLHKTRHTENQAALNKEDRLKNLRGAFTVKGARNYRHIALIDDVVTTRATVETLARLLQKQGVNTVEVWCLARTAKPG